MKLVKRNDPKSRGNDVQQQPNETSHGAQGAPALPREVGLPLSGPSSLHGSSATGANAGDRGSSAFPQTIRVLPMRPRLARPPRPAAGGDGRRQPIAADVDGAEVEPPLLLEGRAAPRTFLERYRFGTQLKRSHGQNDFIAHDLPRQLRVVRLEGDTSDAMRPEPLGYNCEICNIDMAFEPRGSNPDVVPVHVVLPCGHCYHGGCFEEMHGYVGKGEDPPCSRCSQNEDPKGN